MKESVYRPESQRMGGDRYRYCIFATYFREQYRYRCGNNRETERKIRNGHMKLIRMPRRYQAQKRQSAKPFLQSVQIPYQTETLYRTCTVRQHLHR
jgi:hypothetical protein